MDELPAEDAIVKVAGDHHIIGFDPHADAIRQPTEDGVRVHYYHDGEIRWAEQSDDGQERWRAPVTSDAEELDAALDAADEFTVMDKRVFDWLASGPLADVRGAHEGLSWGIALVFGETPERWSRPNATGLLAVPGIGNKLSEKIARAIEAAETQPGDSDVPAGAQK